MLYKFTSLHTIFRLLLTPSLCRNFYATTLRIYENIENTIIGGGGCGDPWLFSPNMACMSAAGEVLVSVVCFLLNLITLELIRVRG